MPGSRALQTAMATSVAAPRATLCHFVELNSSAGVTRLVTARQDISWNSFTWLGSGGVLEVGPVQEAGGSSAPGIPLTLSGVDQTIIAEIMAAHVRGRLVRIWLAHLADNGTVVADPIGPFSGFLNDDWVIEEAREEQNLGTVTVKTTAGTMAELGAQTRTLVCSAQAHDAALLRIGAISAGQHDTFFSTVPSIAGRWANWGGGARQIGGVGPRGDGGPS